jgi:hypothetical protein
MKAYNVLCLVVFDVAIPNDRHRDWFPARTILMYDCITVDCSVHGWRCKHPYTSLVRLPPMHA